MAPEKGWKEGSRDCATFSCVHGTSAEGRMSIAFQATLRAWHSQLDDEQVFAHPRKFRGFKFVEASIGYDRGVSRDWRAEEE